MTETAKELHINAKGEAIWKESCGSAAAGLPANPFMRFSDELIEHWDPSAVEKLPRTWHSTLGGKGSADIDPKQKQELFLQDFLNAILPPIPTTVSTTDGSGDAEGATAYSPVSTKQTKRAEINDIGAHFNELVQQRRARKVGLDDIRHQLSFQLFDEMVRQTAIDCKERGLLLLRIRDEAKVTLSSYKLLNRISSAFSTNKAEESSSGFDELIRHKQQLQEKKRKLENERLRLQNQQRDKQKEVDVLAAVQAEQLKNHKVAIQNQAKHLRALIEQKKRRRSRHNRRGSVHHGGQSTFNRAKSTRRQSQHHTQFFGSQSPPMSPASGSPTNQFK